LKKRGVFVTFEGGDGAGKTTLIERLYREIEQEGRSVIQTRAPGGTALGEKIRSLLLHEQVKIDRIAELFLFLADRAHHVHEVIIPALMEGKDVLCDRFNDSTIAYQGVARALDPAWVSSLCLFATKGLEPDITFYLDIDPEIGLQRTLRKSGTKDRVESEALEFHQKIRASFQNIAKEHPKRVHLLDASQSPDLVFTQAYEVLRGFLQSRR
jgi:dTMP kinase